MLNSINFMIQANELNETLKTDKDTIVIDVRSQEEYNNGHIFNAVNFPEISTYLPKGMTTKKEKRDFINFYEELFSKAGVYKDELVVFYEDKFTFKAPRGLSILKYLGYDEKNIKVLDAGYVNWIKNGFDTNKEVIHNIEKKFTANIDESFFVDYDEMLTLINDTKVIKLDVRDKDEWIGISSSLYGINFAPKKGRLPNAIWIEWYSFITNDMLSVESLQRIKKELKKKNIKKDDDIVLYCFKGARLSNSYIALRKLGYKHIRIYFAGWNEWCRQDNAPIINEAQNSDNPLLKENISLKNKLEDIYLKDASLIDFPKYNKEPIFAFDRNGNIVFENDSKKTKLPNVRKISDVISDLKEEDIYNIIDNKETRTITLHVENKYYLLNFIGCREVNRILIYGFETTEIENLNKNLFSQYSLVQNIVNTVPVRIFWKDKNGEYLGANRLFLEDVGLETIDEIIGKTDFDMPWGEKEAQLYRDDDALIMQNDTPKLHYEEMKINNQGETMVLSTSKVPLKDKNDNIIGILGSYADITHQREMAHALTKQKDILEYQAHHDPLTGLPNRLLFNDRLSQAIQKAKRSFTKIALLFIDLDHFKEINDSLGHDIGDEVLKSVTDRLNKALHEQDTLARLGGDEFTIIIEDLKLGQDVSSLSKKILEVLSKEIIINGNSLYVSSSIGISIYPDDGVSTQNLLKYADAAMYKAKAEGRNNFQYYSSEMTELAFERVVMESSFRESLKNEDFIVYYQPQVDARTNKLIGMEALVRWNHPTMGIISPAKFIPLAEVTGLIVELDRYVMKSAMGQISTWYRQGLNPGVLAMNLAVKQLQQEDFIAMFKSLIKETTCRTQWLELEVTEGQIMTDPEEAIKILNAISNLGIELAVDDFGTGYSSLSYLKKLPIDKLKIDQAFINNLPNDEEDVAIAKAIIALALSLNLHVIAEGVETEAQKDFLLKNGCNNIQGYYYSKPIPADEMEIILKNKGEFFI